MAARGWASPGGPGSVLLGPEFLPRSRLTSGRIRPRDNWTAYGLLEPALELVLLADGLLDKPSVVDDLLTLGEFI